LHLTFDIKKAKTPTNTSVNTQPSQQRERGSGVQEEEEVKRVKQKTMED